MPLLNMVSKHLAWDIAIDEAFNTLKTVFTTIPILKRPDLSKPSIVEVDALESEIGAVLSQRFGEKPILHLMAFY